MPSRGNFAEIGRRPRPISPRQSLRSTPPGTTVERRRILFMTPQIPYPPEQGTAIRNYNLIVQVAKRHDLALLSFAGDSPSGGDAGPLQALCRPLIVVPTPERSPIRLSVFATVETRRPTGRLSIFSMTRQYQWYDSPWKSTIVPYHTYSVFPIYSTSYIFESSWMEGMRTRS